MDQQAPPRIRCATRTNVAWMLAGMLAASVVVGILPDRYFLGLADELHRFCAIGLWALTGWLFGHREGLRHG